jgi:hypothetical protein
MNTELNILKCQVIRFVLNGCNAIFGAYTFPPTTTGGYGTFFSSTGSILIHVFMASVGISDRHHQFICVLALKSSSTRIS